MTTAQIRAATTAALESRAVALEYTDAAWTAEALAEVAAIAAELTRRETTTTAAADLASLPAHSMAALDKRHRNGENLESMLAALPRIYDDNGDLIEAR